MKNMGMTESEVFEAMGAALVERGLASQAQVDADRATQPFNTPTEPAVKTVDTTNLPTTEVDPAAAQLDQSIFAGPASPDGYRFIAPPNGVSRDVAQEQSIRAAFHDIGLPTSTAAHVDRLWNQTLQAPPTEAQLESSRQQAHMQLSRTFGNDVSTVIAVAQKEFARMAAKAPHIVAMAERSGLGNDPMLISALFNNARAKGRA